jgi:hypothetical protein
MPEVKEETMEETNKATAEEIMKEGAMDLTNMPQTATVPTGDYDVTMVYGIKMDDGHYSRLRDRHQEAVDRYGLMYYESMDDQKYLVVWDPDKSVIHVDVARGRASFDGDPHWENRLREFLLETKAELPEPAWHIGLIRPAS